MPRLFVAIEVPVDVQTRLDTLEDERLKARWVPSGNRHLTLKFIGQVAPDAVEHISDALARVAAPPVTVALRGLHVFPSYRRPRILVATVEPDDVLGTLHRDVEQELQEIGIPRETKSYRPHITVARLKHERPETVREFVRDKSPSIAASFVATGFRLYESVLKPTGASYGVRSEFSLTT